MPAPQVQLHDGASGPDKWGHSYVAAGHTVAEVRFIPPWDRRYGMLTTDFSEVFNSVLKGAWYVPITASVQMTFYRVNNYFVLQQKAAAVRISEGGVYPTQISAKPSGIRGWGERSLHEAV